MKYRLWLLSAVLLACGGPYVAHAASETSSHKGSPSRSGPDCPADVPLARQYLVEFLLDQDDVFDLRSLAIKERFYSAAQIELVNDVQDAAACQYFNDYFESTLSYVGYSEELDVPFYSSDVIYYKGEGFYFPVILVNHSPEGCYGLESEDRSKCWALGLYVYDEQLEGLLMQFAPVDCYGTR